MYKRNFHVSLLLFTKCINPSTLDEIKSNLLILIFLSQNMGASGFYILFFIFLCIVQNSHCSNVLGYSDI